MLVYMVPPPGVNSVSYSGGIAPVINGMAQVPSDAVPSMLANGWSEVVNNPISSGQITRTGVGTPAVITYCSYLSFDTIPSSLQENIQNLSSNAAASSDYIVTDDTGTNTTNYGDFGINSSGWGSNPGTFNNAHGVYFYASNYDLAIGTATAQPIYFVYNSLQAGQINATGLSLHVAGMGLQIPEGANCKQGVATLTAGTVTVANTSVTANSRIFLAGQAINSSTAIGDLNITARTAGTNFTITSITAGAVTTQTGDLRTVAYEIFEPGV